MAFVKIEDLSGIMEVVVFPRVYAKSFDLWRIDQIVTIGGRIDEKDGRLTLLADDADVFVKI